MMLCPSVLRIVLPSLLALVLSGCFRSERPLIESDKADFPFETLTYAEAGDGQRITLIREDDGYRPDDKETGERLLLQELGDGVYLAQIKASESEGPGYLYGIIVVSSDLKDFKVSAGYADKEDLAAVQDGIEGLALCADDADTVCIEEPDAYRGYAVRDDVVERGTSYRIIEKE